MNHIQINIEAPEDEQEILISELAELQAIGFEQTSTHLIAYFEENNFESYEVNGLIKNRKFSMTTLPKQNWNAVWEENFQPVIVGNFCAIRAHFHQEIKNVEHEIVITPKMSFGTGHHATTYMMIEQMRAIDFINKNVFDFGTGTGILVILASKLGAASITAIDNDEWSIENAEENFQKNNIQSVNLYASSVIPENKFDIVLANINRNVLEQYASTLVNILSAKGILLVSGILEQDEKFIVDIFKNLRVVNIQQKENWKSIFFAR